MRKLTTMLAMLALLTLALPAGAASSRVVTNSNDSGPGSLRSALEAGRGPITIHPKVGDIEIDTGLVWSSGRELVIKGSGQAVTDSDGSASGALLTVVKGADTTITRLDFRGPGAFDIDHQGGGNAIKIEVPSGAKGDVELKLHRLNISDVGLHGVHVDDLTNATSASIEVEVDGVVVSNVGHGGFDQDGIRVDERGRGDIEFESKASQFVGVGADGVELDEGGPGDVEAKVSRSAFEANGNYCSFRFEEGALAAAGVVLLDDFEELAIIIDPVQEQVVRDLYEPNQEECLEFVADEGEMEVAIDIDDAFDIDEADEGSIVSKVSRTSVVANEDEGLDYDETGPGHIVGSVDRLTAVDNTDEAVKYTEDGPGNVIAKNSRIDGPGQDIEFEELGDGRLDVSLSRSTIDDYKLLEEDSGDFEAEASRTTMDGVEGEETGEGDLEIALSRSIVDGDIELEQEAPGEGTFSLRMTTHNGDLDLTGVTEG